MFAFTYVYVGITFLFNLDGSGVGWFSLFVAIAALFYAFVSFTTNDIIGGVTWLFWAALWSLFFLGMGMNRPIDAITARVALVLSWLTLIVPALIGLRFGYFSSAYQWLWSGLCYSDCCLFPLYDDEILDASDDPFVVIDTWHQITNMKRGPFPNIYWETDLFRSMNVERYNSSATPTGKESAIGTFVRDGSDPDKSHKVRDAAADFPPEESADGSSVRFVIHQT
ncbi:hypothetical protein OVA29_03475 [Exiguobacterium sp. SL14]|nr:hypothetical protein [Exiguobacterium sp. SL14]